MNFHEELKRRLEIIVETKDAIANLEKFGGKLGENRGEIDWDKEPLGDVPDKLLARKLGVTVRAVGKQRAKRGIPPAKTIEKIKKEIEEAASSIDWDAQPLGRLPDALLATNIKVPRSLVTHMRQERGIPPFTNKNSSPKKWDHIDWENLGLGQIPDTQISKKMGIPLETVRRHRKAMGIAPATSALFGKIKKTPAEKAPKKEYPVPKHLDDIDWTQVPLGIVSDLVIAEALNTSTVTVAKARDFYNIEPTSGNIGRSASAIDMEWSYDFIAFPEKY